MSAESPGAGGRLRHNRWSFLVERDANRYAGTGHAFAGSKWTAAELEGGGCRRRPARAVPRSVNENWQRPRPVWLYSYQTCAAACASRRPLGRAVIARVSSSSLFLLTAADPPRSVIGDRALTCAVELCWPPPHPSVLGAPRCSGAEQGLPSGVALLRLIERTDCVRFCI